MVSSNSYLQFSGFTKSPIPCEEHTAKGVADLPEPEPVNWQIKLDLSR